jgi:hypothetical protein
MAKLRRAMTHPNNLTFIIRDQYNWQLPTIWKTEMVRQKLHIREVILRRSCTFFLHSLHKDGRSDLSRRSSVFSLIRLKVPSLLLSTCAETLDSVSPSSRCEDLIHTNLDWRDRGEENNARNNPRFAILPNTSPSEHSSGLSLGCILVEWCPF